MYNIFRNASEAFLLSKKNREIRKQKEKKEIEEHVLKRINSAVLNGRFSTHMLLDYSDALEVEDWEELKNKLLDKKYKVEMEFIDAFDTVKLNIKWG